MKLNRKIVKIVKETMTSAILNQINSEEGYYFFEYDEDGQPVVQHLCAADVEFDGTVMTATCCYDNRLAFASEQALRQFRNGTDTKKAKFITWAWYN